MLYECPLIPVEEDYQQWAVESLAGLESDEQKLLCNVKKHFTVAFKYLVTGRYCIAITSSPFQSYVCKWIGTVSDCYVLHTNSLGKPAAPFSAHDNHGAHHDSSEKENL